MSCTHVRVSKSRKYVIFAVSQFYCQVYIGYAVYFNAPDLIQVETWRFCIVINVARYVVLAGQARHIKVHSQVHIVVVSLSLWDRKLSQATGVWFVDVG